MDGQIKKKLLEISKYWDRICTKLFKNISSGDEILTGCRALFQITSKRGMPTNWIITGERTRYLNPH